ncbi:hypothetical protein O181_007975 [Austropuccinia psidii MF-1]|uniref:Uncharacterized protein n=1 Tax=Austropuccinia psidii MF-1 TaxID=1389203 RepID=A0A9Q3BNG5_9BASI|nr:hypothetical protein [Austropuccinia psidii MF-1]
MTPVQHIDPLPFVTDTLTKSNMHVPDSDTQIFSSSDSILLHQKEPRKGALVFNKPDDESLEYYNKGNEDYIVAKDNGPYMNDVTPPKRTQPSKKIRSMQ